MTVRAVVAHPAGPVAQSILVRSSAVSRSECLDGDPSDTTGQNPRSGHDVAIQPRMRGVRAILTVMGGHPVAGALAANAGLGEGIVRLRREQRPHVVLRGLDAVGSQQA